jgi:hypothetical protein
MASADRLCPLPVSPCNASALPSPIPSLQDLCVSYIAKNLHLFPSLSPLPWHLAELVVREMPLRSLQISDNWCRYGHAATTGHALLAALPVHPPGTHAACLRVRDADLPLLIGSGHAPAAQLDFLSFRGCALVSREGSLPNNTRFCSLNPVLTSTLRAGFCSALPHFAALTVIDLGMCEQVVHPPASPSLPPSLHFSPAGTGIWFALSQPRVRVTRPASPLPHPTPPPPTACTATRDPYQVDDSVISCLARSCRRVATLDVTACKLLTDVSSGNPPLQCSIYFFNPPLQCSISFAGEAF